MLELLVRNRGTLGGRKQLLHEVWDQAYESETHYQRVYLVQLRRTLEPQPARPGSCSPKPAWATDSSPETVTAR
jgi:two-component system KDP operon response regulator KdpE